MDLVRDLISLGRNAREIVKIKVRQPISEVLLDGKTKKIIGDLEDLIKEELNVKNITYITDLSKYMNYELKPNFKVVGKIFGPKIKLYQDELQKLGSDDIKLLEDGKNISMTIDGELYEVTPEMVDIRVEAKEGYDAQREGSNFIILNTNLTDELINEGYARELISKIQNLRKEKDFDVADRIKLYYESNEKLEEVLNSFNEMIKKEILALEFIEKDNLVNEFDLNGIVVKLDVEKA